MTRRARPPPRLPPRSQFHEALGAFLDYALAKPDVWVVTHAQLLDWMEAPVPASRMSSWMQERAGACAGGGGRRMMGGA